MLRATKMHHRKYCAVTDNAAAPNMNLTVNSFDWQDLSSQFWDISQTSGRL